MKQPSIAFAFVVAFIAIVPSSAKAQIAAFASISAKHQSSIYRAPEAMSENAKIRIPVTTSRVELKDALYDNYESEIEALPAVQFFPTKVADFKPGSGSKTGLMYGLFGVLLLGLTIQRLTKQASLDRQS